MTQPSGGRAAGAERGGRHTRRALIIANDTYDHASLSALRAPEADARALAEVLGDPEIGGFDVSIVHNAASYEVQAHVDDLFADSRPEDLLLLHFSGHGLKNDAGELFIAARNTRPDRLGSTALAADFVQRCMRSSRARSIVLFLDCCYGGAFGQGVTVRAAGPVNVMDSFPAGRLGGGRGRAVISASSAMEYSFEGTTLAADHQVPPSIFTSAVVEGLRTGEADRDEDGLVSLNELYDYVFDRVRETNPNQTPGRDVEMSGELYLARSRRRRVRPVPIPDPIASALRESDPTYRRGAVSELRDRLAHPDLGVALGALEALQEVARSDTKAVADDASAVLQSAAPHVSPTSLDFGELGPGAVAGIHRELRVTGIPLARDVRVDAEPPLSAVVEGTLVTVTLTPTGRAYAGSLTLTSPTGSVVVPVTASVAESGAPDEESATRGSRPPPPPAPAELPSAAPAVAQHVTGTSELGPRHRLRVAAGLAALAAGLLILASMTLPWRYGQTYAAGDRWLVPSMAILGLLVVTAGAVMFAPRVRTEVSLGLLLAVSGTAAASLLTYLGLVADLSPDASGTGTWFGLIGLVLAASCGPAAVAVAAWRQAVPLARVDWRDPGSLAALGLGAVTAAVFISYAVHLGSLSDAGYEAGVTYVWAVLTVIAAIGAVMVRPAAVGRVLLAAWGLGTLSYSLSQWVYLTDHSPESFGMPFLVAAGLALSAAALLIDRRSPSDAAAAAE
ncbi:caspase family protein [Terrabacter sp. C0L_2]|uniref:caspase family protein n=1 Tax=Terrabacter sp. C0L_2 TaxID=3108389 RepID=UPI002ED65E6D|nr:caspase family protein [Terrabacter sp. C0L_2]